MSQGLRRSLEDLMSAPEGVPQRADFSVMVRGSAPKGKNSQLHLTMYDDLKRQTGTARVYWNEWYPGTSARPRWSHYFPTLRYCLRGLNTSGSKEPIRLQVLKAVVVTLGGERVPVFLKFIIAPEYSIAATRMETAYGCSLRAFYTGFVGVARDPRESSGRADWIAGSAIHAGYRAAAQSFVRGEEDGAVSREYLEAVVEAYLDDLANLVRAESAGPTRLQTRPLKVMGQVIDRCHDQWEDARSTELLQERLFFSPKRGILGKADRISYVDDEVRLHELKTGASFGERDPRTGKRVQGGLQAAAYFELMDALGERPTDVYVEQLDTDDEWEELPLREHPVISRARSATNQGGYDRYIDLLAQNRNIAYCLESGLPSGYDRKAINDIGGYGRSPRMVGGDFDLQAQAPPCSICEANSRGICEASRTPAPLAGTLFRFLPDELYAYWVWFHRALKREDSAARTALYRLVNTPPYQLEHVDGITVSGLSVREAVDRTVVLERRSRIDTRLREDDRILLTPQDAVPGEIRSVDGVITDLSEHTIRLRLGDTVDADGRRYRVDKLGYWERLSWQVEGLTDFLTRCMAEAEVGGRKLELTDLPVLPRRILGALPPVMVDAESVPPAPRLNEEHRRVIGAALAMNPTDMMLVQGPPGTGKTGMIAYLVRHLVQRRFFEEGNKPVLVLANTHRAADEVTIRLHALFPDLRPYIVRVGRPRYNTEPEVAAHSLAEKLDARERLRPEQFAASGPDTLVRLGREGRLVLENAAVFVGTLASARAGELKGLTFDWVVVDEAGQATEPAALQATRHLPKGFAGRLLLVGDHMQLPPVVPDDEIRDEPSEELDALGIEPGDGLKTSLFERLARKYPDSVTTLHRQYRMNSDICALVSNTFYGRRLVPGSDEVASRTLDEALDLYGGTAPDDGILSSKYSVVFVDTSNDLRATEKEGENEESRYNEFEARLLARLLLELSECVPDESVQSLLAEVGVISAYRRQNNLIRQELMRLRPELGAVRVDTVDRFQGGERDVMLLSLVNSSATGAIGTLHADARRMNVAISRARRKLIIVGNRRTFTLSRRPDEESAKTSYRRMFEQIDQLAERGRALAVDSRTLL